MRLGKINASNGLSYLLSASNESLLADVQGYEVHDPNITIEYQQSLANQGSMPLPPPPGFIGYNLNLALLLAAASLLFAGAALIVFMAHRESASRKSAIVVADAITAAPSIPVEEKELLKQVKQIRSMTESTLSRSMSHPTPQISPLRKCH